MSINVLYVPVYPQVLHPFYPQHRCATWILPTAQMCYRHYTHRCYMERSGRQEIGGNGSFCRPQIINGQFLAPCNSLQRHKYTNTGLTFPKCALHQCSLQEKMIFGLKSLNCTDFVFVFCTQPSIEKYDILNTRLSHCR